MTNERVRRGFMEVYNEFWNRYKNNTPTRDSGEWERIRTWSVVLQKKYPFLKETILSLEVTPLENLAREGKLGIYKHPGFWQCMDTQRDRSLLEGLWAGGQAPWRVWEDNI